LANLRKEDDETETNNPSNRVPVGLVLRNASLLAETGGSGRHLETAAAAARAIEHAKKTEEILS
jgi:hypothetical protein